MSAKNIFLHAVCLVILVSVMGGCASTKPQNISLQSIAKENVEKNPKSPGHWVEYGRLCLYSQDAKGAEKAFRKAIELDSAYLAAYKHLGLLLVSTKRLKEAKTTYKKALNLNREDSELWTAYGYCLADMNEPDDALKAFQKSAESNSSQVAVVSAHLGASGIFQKRGDQYRADQEYEKALKINPDVAKILNRKPSASQEPSAASAQSEKELKIALWTDRNDGIYSIGDEIKFFFKVNKTCKVKMVMVRENGEETLLYPNAYETDNSITPDKVYMTPDKESRYLFKVQGPAGKAVVRISAIEKSPAGGEIADTEGLWKQTEKTITILEKRQR